MEKKMKEEAEHKYSWKEKYDHVCSSYMRGQGFTWRWIAETYGPEALDEYFKRAMTEDVLGRSTFQTFKKGISAEELVKGFVPHHLMIGGEVKVRKVTPDEVVVDVVKCGSKSLLVENDPSSAKYYCRHCEVIPIYEAIGWPAERDRTKAAKLKGQNIGCTVTFRRKK